MTVTRYTDGGPEGWMQSPTGEFVRYEDYEQLQKQLEGVRQARLTWAMACECFCAACMAFDKVVISPEPQDCNKAP